jgi:hypothetical protein
MSGLEPRNVGIDAKKCQDWSQEILKSRARNLEIFRDNGAR